MALIVAGYREDISKYIERGLEDRLSNIYVGNRSQEEIEMIRERCRTNYHEWINNEVKLRNFILDTPEIREKAPEYAESVRKKNVELLKEYGVFINNRR